METVDITLGHSAGAAHFKADLTSVDTIVQSLEALDTNVLQRVLDTGDKVGDELGDGATVQDGTSDTLGDQDAVLLGEVASGTGVGGAAVLVGTSSLLVLHGGDTAHSTVGLNELTLVANEVLARRLGGTGKETTHHNGAGTHGQTLNNVTNVLDTTVGDTGNTEASGEVGDAADSGGLGTTDSHNLLGDTGATGAHANSQAIGTSSDQGSGLLAGNNVTGNNIDLGESLLNPLDHVDHEHGVTLGAVQDDNVQTSLNKALETGLVLLTSSDSGSTDQLLGVGELGSKGVVEVLHQVGAGQQRDEVTLAINDGQLALLGLTENIVGLGQGGTGRGGDQVSGHDGSDGVVQVTVELNVTGSNHTNQLGAEGTILCQAIDVSIEAQTFV